LTKTLELKNLVVGIKGAGDIATGVASRLFKSNIKKIFMMEVKAPLAVRRQVSFCEAICEGSFVVEGIQAVKVTDEIGIQEAWKNGTIPGISMGCTFKHRWRGRLAFTKWRTVRYDLQ
jgi:xanthine dehydrogenase accessory factor